MIGAPSRLPIASRVPLEPSSSTDLPRVVAAPSPSATTTELGIRTEVPWRVVVLLTSRTVEVPPPVVLWRWTTIVSRFCGPVAVFPFASSSDPPGSMPADQR